MLSTTRSRAVRQVSRVAFAAGKRTLASTASSKQATSGSKEVPNISKTNELPVEAHHGGGALQESAKKAEELRVQQAPNRVGVWSRSQNPRANAMTGPRFEQTIMELQPAPQAAIGLIHKQPVRWVHDPVAVCDGGGGPLGHPRVFINTDKPQICMCEYCGLPYANEHHRKHLESLPVDQLAYPLSATGDAAEVPESQRITDEALGQR